MKEYLDSVASDIFVASNINAALQENTILLKGDGQILACRLIWVTVPQYLRYDHITWWGWSLGQTKNFGIPRPFHGKSFFGIFKLLKVYLGWKSGAEQTRLKTQSEARAKTLFQMLIIFIILTNLN